MIDRNEMLAAQIHAEKDMEIAHLRDLLTRAKVHVKANADGLLAEIDAAIPEIPEYCTEAARNYPPEVIAKGRNMLPRTA